MAYREAARPGGGSFEDPRLRRVQQFVEEHPEEPVTLAQAASIAMVGRTYFSRLFHRLTGQCFRDWLAEDRVGRAKGMLVEGEGRSVTEVAFCVGFNSLSTFERTFKRVEGVSPSTFRRREIRRRKPIKRRATDAETSASSYR